MPSETATVFTPGDSHLMDPSSPEGISTDIGRGDLEDKWEELESRLRTQNKAIEHEERYDSEPWEMAFEIAFSFPDKVDVEIKPYGRDRDLTEHVRNHFDSLLNESSSGGSLRKGAASDWERMLKACELVYIDDAMYRYSDLTLITPEVDGLAQVGFVGMPDGVQDPVIDEWHKELEVAWSILMDRLHEGIRLDEKIDDLYARREEFIDHCMESNVYMPITTEVSNTVEALEKNLKRRLRRNSEADPAKVHEYCYLKTQNV